MKHVMNLFVLAAGALALMGCYSAQVQGKVGEKAQPVAQSGATNEGVIVCGPLKLEIVVSGTAHLFHVVDQVSLWSEFCHRQYPRYCEGLEGGLSAKDRELLAQHVAIRKKRGWGGGLEQAFYTPLELEPALARAVKEGWLTEQEAATERMVFKQFQARVERLMEQEKPNLERLRQQISDRQTNLVAYATMMARFVGSTELTIPVYLMANPDESSIGGGYNGGRLTLEVARGRDCLPTLLHETWHAFLLTKRSVMEGAARSVPGLDSETLSEGLAYAFSPGILEATNSDPLLRSVSADLARNLSLQGSYTRFRMYGLALRPLLRQALSDSGQSLESFLRRATDAWLVLRELDQARTVKATAQEHDYRKDPRHSVFMFGLWDEEANRALSAATSRHLFGRAHTAKDYRAMLTEKAKPEDTIILLVALEDTKGRVPAEYADLLPVSWAEVEGKLGQGQTVFAKGQARGMTVYLVAAPGVEQLRKEFRRLAAEKKISVNTEL